jgi:solute carrier family 31 (copper transporter), member 1
MSTVELLRAEPTHPVHNSITVPTVSRLLRATLYGATVFLSFFLMLIFMTYNVSFARRPIVNTCSSPQAYLILAVVLGAAIGHYVFGGRMDVNAVLSGAGPAGKTMACH